MRLVGTVHWKDVCGGARPTATVLQRGRRSGQVQLRESQRPRAPSRPPATAHVTSDAASSESALADADVIHMSRSTGVAAAVEFHTNSSGCPAWTNLCAKSGPPSSAGPYTASCATGAPT